MIRRNIALVFGLCLIATSYASADDKVETTGNQHEDTMTHQTTPDNHTATDDHSMDTHAPASVEKHKKQHNPNTNTPSTDTNDSHSTGSTPSDYPVEAHQNHDGITH